MTDDKKTEKKVVIKRVNAYPINIQLTGKLGVFMAKIIKLGPSGFLVETENKPLSVNDSYMVNFFVPMVIEPIDTECVVVKTYDQHSGRHAGSSHVYRMSELSFKRLSPKQKETIEIFLKKTGQLEPKKE